MLDLKKFKTNNEETSGKRKRFKSTGEYTAVVTDVRYPEGYVENEAFEIEYSVTTKGGNKIYSELFFNKNYNSRTSAFFEYLLENHIPLTEMNKFIGCKEKLTFKRHVTGNRSMLSIVERKFVAHRTEN